MNIIPNLTIPYLFPQYFECLQTLESAGKQPTNWGLVSEAAHASACLAKMPGVATAEFWKLVNTSQLMVNDRSHH